MFCSDVICPSVQVGWSMQTAGLISGNSWLSFQRWLEILLAILSSRYDFFWVSFKLSQTSLQCKHINLTLYFSVMTACICQVQQTINCSVLWSVRWTWRMRWMQTSTWCHSMDCSAAQAPPTRHCFTLQWAGLHKKTRRVSKLMGLQCAPWFWGANFHVTE